MSVVSELSVHKPSGWSVVTGLLSKMADSPTDSGMTERRFSAALVAKARRANKKKFGSSDVSTHKALR